MDLFVPINQAFPYRAKALGPQSTVTIAATYAMPKPPCRMSKWEPSTGNSTKVRVSVA